MSLQTYMLIMVSLGFVLGVLATQLVRYAGEYVARISAGRIAAMRAHPAGGRGNLHVGTIHVPRSRGRDTDGWWEKIYGKDDEPLAGLEEWGVIRGPQPEDYAKVPAQRQASNELPPGWEFPMECSE